MVVIHELRFAARRLLKRPGYTALSAGVLGMGLGMVLFLFTMVNTEILQPFPFPHAGRLVSVGADDGNGVGAIDSDQYLALKDTFQGIERMGAWKSAAVNLDNGAGATYYRGGQMTASMMQLLGVKPLLGRGLIAADDAPGTAPAVLLGETLWRHAFKADPHIIGRAVKVDGRAATVVGVLPKRFNFPINARVWLPLPLQTGQHLPVESAGLLAPGVGIRQAHAELNSWAGRLQRMLPPEHQTVQLTVQPIWASLIPSDLRHWVWVMFGAGVLVLLLACLNVANLQLVQTLQRRHELALRSALGSSASRLMLGALAESLLLSVAALALAFLLTWGGLRWLKVAWIDAHPSTVPYMHGIDAWVVAFAIVVALLSTLLAGGIPAWRASRTELQDALRSGSKGSSGGFARVSKILVVAEVALTVVLLVGAGMFVGAMDHLLAQPTAGATHATHVLTAAVALPQAAYSNDTKRIQFFDTVVQRLRQDPGVVDATVSDTMPGGYPAGSYADVALPGHARPFDGWPQTQMGIVGPQFLHTYGVRLRQGRFFDAHDDAHGAPVVVVDTEMAAATWPHTNPLGRQLILYPDTPQARTVTVIGVIDPLQLGNAVVTVLPGVLMPVQQAPGLSPLQSVPLQSVGLAVRTHADAASFIKRLTSVVHAVDPQAAIYNARTQARTIAGTRGGIMLLTDVFSALGLVALLLAAAGLYGVLAFSVMQRTREIGIRRAIGAGNNAIVREVGRALGWQLGLGLLIGGLLALPWSSLLANPRLHTRAHDPGVFVPVLLLVIGVSLIAALVPLLRALRVDPAVALRYE